MKKLLLALSLFISLSAYAEDSCNPDRVYLSGPCKSDKLTYCTKFAAIFVDGAGVRFHNNPIEMITESEKVVGSYNPDMSKEEILWSIETGIQGWKHLDSLMKNPTYVPNAGKDFDFALEQCMAGGDA